MSNPGWVGDMYKVRPVNRTVNKVPSVGTRQMVEGREQAQEARTQALEARREAQKARMLSFYNKAPAHPPVIINYPPPLKRPRTAPPQTNPYFGTSSPTMHKKSKNMSGWVPAVPMRAPSP